MNHIDEGTIHAWLDGALSEEHARAVESHVATCGECSAAVAEARGLIAGASRILTALDDVPANVTPKRAPSRAPQPRRQWRAAPWVTGIAAALILAVGVTTWNRDRARMMESDANERFTRDSSLPLVASSPDSNLAAAAPAPAAPTPRGGTLSAQKGTVDLRRDAPREERSAQARRRDGARGVAGAIVPERSNAPAAADAASGSEREQSSARIAVGGADTTRLGKAARATQLSEVVVTSLPPSSALRDASLDANEAAGCYQVAMGGTEQKAAVGAPSVAATRSAAREGAAARARPAAPSSRADFAATAPVPLIQLDTVRIGGALVVRAVKDAPDIANVSADSTLGRWEPISADSLRVRFSSGRFLTLARSARTRCPER